MTEERKKKNFCANNIWFSPFIVIMFASLSAEMGINILECAPCAVEAWLLQREENRRRSPDFAKRSPWNLLVADAVLDMALSSLIVSGATKVLLPFRLMEFMENTRVHGVSASPSSNSEFSTFHSTKLGSHSISSSDSTLLAGVQKKWETLASQASSSTAILLPNYKNLSSFLELNRCTSSSFSSSPVLFRQVVIPVPSSPISTRMLFPEISSEGFFYQSILPEICEKIAVAQTATSESGEIHTNTPQTASSPHNPCHSDVSQAFSRSDSSWGGREVEESEAGFNISWFAWMRSALSCRFEGEFPSPIRLGDNTAAILNCDTSMLSSSFPYVNAKNEEAGHTVGTMGLPFSYSSRQPDRRVKGDGKCAGVIWEEGVSNSLTPRWMETILKTAAVCGVPLSRVALSFSRKSSATPLTWMKAVEGSVSQFVSCSLANSPLFPYTDARITIPSLQGLVAGFNESVAINKEIDESDDVSSMSPEYSRLGYKNSWRIDNAQLEKSREWCAALRETWDELKNGVNPDDG